MNHKEKKWKAMVKLAFWDIGGANKEKNDGEKRKRIKKKSYFIGEW